MKTFIAALLLVCLSIPAFAAGETQTVFDRIMKAQTIRCGYFTFPPLSVKDPKTGELSGITVGLFNKMAASLNLKVDWAEEVSFAGLVPGLQTGRYDAICTPMWPTAARAREVEFVEPMFYAALGVWVRADDDRFTGKLDSINDPAVTIAGIDGQIEQTVHDEQFPKAKMISHPGGTDFAEEMMDVATKKADVTFVDRAAGAQFMAAHPGLLKDIAGEKPLRVFPFSVAVPGGEIRLKNMLDQAVEELQNTGAIDRELRNADPKKTFLQAAKPYEIIE